MSGWAVAVAVTVGVLFGTWVALALLARRLPPGRAREMAAFLPNCVTLARRLRRDARVPRRARLALGAAALWVLSPVDLVPEFLPVIGPLDDVVVVALALRYAARQVPWAVLEEAWPGDAAALPRLLAPTRPTGGARATSGNEARRRARRRARP
jgi:uncharacterized membrane protein YkvA (DUF1232 family)